MVHSILRAITKLYPLQTPRASLLRLLPAVPAQFGPFRTRDGIEYAAYPSGGDHVVKNLFWFGEFDPWVGHTIARHLKPGDVYCDIGANIGDTALPMAKLVGPGGRVFAFEPFPPIRECLLKNVAANGIGNLEAVGIALSDSRGELSIDVPEGQPGMATLQNASSAGGVRVPTVPFDEWRAQAGVDTVAVCKVDVEGHEEAVFRGMAQSLDEKRIAAIVFERHGNAGAGDPVIELLRGHDYRVRQIRKRALSTAYADIGSTGPGAPTPDFLATIE